MGNWFSSSSSAQKTEVNGQATNVIVEEGLSKIDAWHTIILLIMLGLLVAQIGLTIYRMHRRAIKRKYVMRLDALTNKGKP